jgi:hypothetical protein
MAILLSASCKGQMQTGGLSSDVKMNINASKNTITQSEKTLPLVVEITNTSDNDIFVLNFADFATDSLSVFQLIIEKNGKKKISPAGLLKKIRKPQARDYKKLKSGETLSFKYDLDMSLLVDDEKHLGQKNNDFGTYKIQVVFHDRFLIKKKTVSCLESNTIEATYIL